MVRGLACFLVVATAGAVSGATVGAAASQIRCQPTISDGVGPFQTNAIATPLRSKIGTGHVLLGRVLSPDCAPVRGAVVYFWQAGPNGYGPRRRARVVTKPPGGGRFEGLA